MKYLFTVIFLMSIVALTGCSDEYNVPNPPLTKGEIISKEFIPSQSFPVSEVLQAQSNTYRVYASTPEIYLISIQTTEATGKGYKLHNRSYYKVSPMLFGELQIGQEVDFKDNKDASPVEVK